MSPEELRARNKARLEAKREQLMANKELGKPIKELTKEVEQLAKSMQNTGIDDAAQAINATVNTLQELSKTIKQTDDKNVAMVAEKVAQLADRIAQIEINPQIEVKPVVDITPITKALAKVEKALGDIKIPETDFSELINATRSTTKAINSLSFPVPNYVLPFKSSEGAATQAQLNSQNAIVTDSPNLATQIKIDSGDTNITYIGKAPIGSATSSAVWQVAKLDATGGELVKTWADSASFTQVFDNREALSYS